MSPKANFTNSLCCFTVSLCLDFSYIIFHLPWPPLLYLLCLSFDWCCLLSVSPWLRPAVPLTIQHRWCGWMFAIPQLSHTGYSSTLSITFIRRQTRQLWEYSLHWQSQINFISRLLQHWFSTAGNGNVVWSAFG